MVVASDQEQLATIPTAGIVVISIYVAAQLLSDIASLKITLIAGISVYDTFCKSAEEWRIPADRIDRDFKIYLATQRVPFYVKDFVRKGQKHIDEMYNSKSSSFMDKRLLVFYSILTLLFWGGAVFVSLYVLPSILPEAFLTPLSLGPP